MEMKNYFLEEDMVLEDLGNGVLRKVLAYNENIMAVELTSEEGSAGAIHSHPHEQITYVIEGEFEFNIDGEKKVLRAGDSVYEGPNVPHGSICLKKGKVLDVFTPHREDFLK
jgi:quercetin dioxygenase-like cupin family protein